MSKQLPSFIGLAVLFVVSFLLFDSVYGYVITFQSKTNGCFFVFGRPFLESFFDHPAGPLRYAGRFLGQFYHYRWLGALVVSASITGFGVLFHRVLVKLGGGGSVARTVAPCALLVALHTSSRMLVYDTLGLSAGCGAFVGYLSFRGKLGRRVYALAATPLLYVALGAYVWLFVAWVVAFEWLDGPLRSGLPFKVAYVVFSGAVPLAAWRWVFPVSLQAALTCPFMFYAPFRSGMPPDRFAMALDVGLAVALCVFLLLAPFSGRFGSGAGPAAFRRGGTGRRWRVALAGAISVAAVLFHVARYDASFDRFVACQRLYEDRRWDALLESAREDPTRDLRVQFMTNFALCHRGTLLDEMFHYPQPWGTRGLVLNFVGRSDTPPEEDDIDVAMFNSDLFYELGYVNAALRHAYNSMSINGQRYDVLKRMAQCNMANGNYDLAAKYLNLLDNTLFHREFARRSRAVLADPDAVEREFGDLRERLPVDDAQMFGHPIKNFVTLLRAKPDNRMATDYLMAWLLLDKKKDSLAAICVGLGHLRNAGYASIPTHCQEALLLTERGERAAVDLQGYRYDEATVARVDGFFRDVSPYWGRPDAPERARPRYGDTYMHYYFLVTTPAEAQRIMGRRRGFGGMNRVE